VKGIIDKRPSYRYSMSMGKQEGGYSLEDGRSLKDGRKS
jgi:hypothetical protein